MLRCVDACCGVGGFSAGAMECGCDVILGIDNDKIVQTWAANTAGRALCATIGEDSIEWPDPTDDLFFHISPPCTVLSRANSTATDVERACGLDFVRWSLDHIIHKGYRFWSWENVCTAATKAVLAEYCTKFPDRIASVQLDAADYSTPQSRIRLIASSPEIIRTLKQTPVHRVSVAQAFAAADQPLPAQYLRSNTNNRDGSYCIRSVQREAFTCTASHPLTWCQPDGQTVRCCTAAEHAILQGFPKSWKFPSGSRLAIRAIGNAIPPPLAAAIIRAASNVAAARSLYRRRLRHPRPRGVPNASTTSTRCHVMITANFGIEWNAWKRLSDSKSVGRSIKNDKINRKP